MAPVRTLLLSCLALVGCASSAQPTAESTSGSETQAPVTETATDDAGITEDAPVEPPPEDLSSFAEPVRARLTPLARLPIAASAPVLSLTLFDASLICAFLDEHVRPDGSVSSECPDGSPVVLGGECNPASVLALRTTFGEACNLRFGDYLACEIAARASPCSVGFMRADLPECEAVNACLATQMPPE